MGHSLDSCVVIKLPHDSSDEKKCLMGNDYADTVREVAIVPSLAFSNAGCSDTSLALSDEYPRWRGTSIQDLLTLVDHTSFCLQEIENEIGKARADFRCPMSSEQGMLARFAQLESRLIGVMNQYGTVSSLQQLLLRVQDEVGRLTAFKAVSHPNSPLVLYAEQLLPVSQALHCRAHRVVGSLRKLRKEVFKWADCQDSGQESLLDFQRKWEVALFSLQRVIRGPSLSAAERHSGLSISTGFPINSIRKDKDLSMFELGVGFDLHPDVRPCVSRVFSPRE
jgi:hypothetical protein